MWTVAEQQQLDRALASNPRINGDTKARWVKVAAQVPSRSLKECVARYKDIRTQLQNQQQQQQQQSPPPQPPQPQPQPREKAKRPDSAPSKPSPAPPVKSLGLSVGYAPPQKPQPGPNDESSVATARDKYLAFQRKQGGRER